ncbi:MAG TPA: hypothetical protein VK572_13145 [Burkholderiales bacterium]|nr:hypothetical protein [Burkholderiales bacterium]
MRYGLVVLWMLLGSVTSAIAQVSVGIALPGVSIGINLPLYPELVQVPGYPVYYAPRLDSNFFFYDGMYWVYQGDNWYASSWYNGPWWLVGPEVVPLFVLRIPVRYYRAPPVYFRGWRSEAPPRWGEHWGNAWQQRRSGWDRWSRSSVPAPAPLPVYQRQYSGNRYPPVEQQQALRSQNYGYQPRTTVVRQHYQAQAAQRAPAPSQRGQQGAPQERSPRQQQDIRRSDPSPSPQQSSVPRSQAPQRGGEDDRRSAPTQAPPQQRGPAVQDRSQPPQQRPDQREQQMPRSSQENNPQGAPQQPRQGQGQERDRERGEERGQERGQERNR